MADQRGRTMFDPKCYELAEYFLPAHCTEGIKSKLAQLIQDEVEAFLRYGEGREYADA